MELENTFRNLVDVSVLVSTYNSETFIEGCLEDLVSQSLFQKGRMEILVLDCASPGNEFEKVRPFQERYPNISFIRLSERETLYGAWNLGVQYSVGKYLTNANTDDRHHPQSLERMTNALDSDPQISLVYGDVLQSLIPNEPFGLNQGTVRYRYKPYFAPDCLLHYQFGCQPMWRRTVHDSLGGFRREMKAAGDYDFNFRFALAGLRAHYLGELTGSFLERPESLSLSDETSINEQRALRAQYLSPQNVFRLFEHEGTRATNDWERAAILHNMSLRALQVEMPWHPGRVFSDAEVALTCISAALQLSELNPTLLNNLAVVLQSIGQLEEANQILSRIESLQPTDHTIAKNLKVYRDGALPQNRLQLCAALSNL